MKTVSIKTFEDIHHVCLMYGLKKAFLRFPFLVRNPLATPPPVRINPTRRQFFFNGIVSVQYFRQDIRVLYDETKVSDKEAEAFAAAVIKEYLGLRHPYLRYTFEGMLLREETSGHQIAEILRTSDSL